MTYIKELDTINEYDDNDSIFHFTKKVKVLENIIPQRKLLFSTTNNFNDPYEYSAIVDHFTGGNHFMPEQEFNEKTENLKKLYKDYYLNKIKILSFSMNNHPQQIYLKEKFKQLNYESDFPYPLDNPYKNLRMWNQYGDNQQGVCIVLSKSKILQQIVKFEEEFNNIKIYKGEIRYEKKEKLPKSVIHLDINTSDLKVIQNEFLNVTTKILAFKSSDFIDEQEFRIIIHDSNNNINDFEIESSIKGIILGDKFPEIYIDIIKNFCENKKIQYYQAKFKFNELFFNPGLVSTDTHYQ